MSARKKQRQSSAMALRWHAALVDTEELPRNRVAVVAIGGIMMRHANSDGHNCRPSLKTIMDKAGVSQRTARLALRWLVSTGWLEVTAEAVRWHSPAVYRLAFPLDAEGHPYGEGSLDADEHPYKGRPLDAPLDAAMDARRHPEVPPPSKSEEEEESASARLPLGRLAALQNPTAADLFSTNPPEVRAPGESVATTDNGAAPPPSPPGPQGQTEAFDSSEAETIEEVCIAVAAHAATTIDQGRLGRALVDAKARTHWSDDALAIYCVEKLKRMGNKVRNPSAFLAADLAQNVDEGTISSPRMKLADVWAKLEGLEAEWTGPNAPATQFEDLANDAGMCRDFANRDYGFDVWEVVKPAQVEQALGLANGVLYKAIERLRQRA